MTIRHDRRGFLWGAARHGLAGVTGWNLLTRLTSVSAQETRLATDSVTFSPDIEPLVRLIEETPRDRLMEVVADKIQRGITYRELLTGLLLAGIRNVQPRPHVGFKFHSVLVVHSAHLASESSPDGDRWLPLLWALDYFKYAQAQDVHEGDWTLRRVDAARVPTAGAARREFESGMDRWDEAAADAAVAALARSRGLNEIFELLFRYGARDTRDIGHKAIFVANSYRALQTLGGRHAEPVLRSLAYALLAHADEPNPSENDLTPDRPWRRHIERVTTIRSDWMGGTDDEAVTREVISALRSASQEEIATVAVEYLNRGTSPQSLWDAAFLFASELVMRQPGIIAVHALTTSNALRFAFDTSANDTTRQLVLLQELAFLVHFRDRLGAPRPWSSDAVDQLRQEVESEPRADAAQIFQHRRQQPLESARRAYAYLAGGGSASALIDEARRLVFAKGSDSHDYKYSSAILEDCFHVSPDWRPQFLAACLFQLHGADEPDNPLIARIRSALAGVRR